MLRVCAAACIAAGPLVSHGAVDVTIGSIGLEEDVNARAAVDEVISVAGIEHVRAPEPGAAFTPLSSMSLPHLPCKMSAPAPSNMSATG